jgi:PKHD-type hydroxylase
MAAFVHLPMAFTDEFLARADEVAATIEAKRGKVGYPYTERVDHAHRKVSSRKILRDMAPDLIDTLNEAFIRANAVQCKYDLDPVLPLAMYLEYGPEDLFHWHFDEDLADHNEHPRKLTAILMLSEPSEFEGGQFEMRLPEMPVRQIPMSRNDLIVFPSYNLHRVLPITKGVRRTLVSWAHGPKWR